MQELHAYTHTSVSLDATMHVMSCDSHVTHVKGSSQCSLNIATRISSTILACTQQQQQQQQTNNKYTLSRLAICFTSIVTRLVCWELEIR